ncbi:HindIII family type II restriction endonuclease [uncultured Brachyspira sp.]|uniref:HindIII family type II restriction endonuclease n=2 Tax=uncultured Brachyspira sp. TaxID=221953 RepID=UPI0025D58C76|nr:HindIII family type II restriction endonuclease [uncultured Brachyspira sp.]
MFNKLIKEIHKYEKLTFDEISEKLEDIIFNTNNFLDIIYNIRIIPESIGHDTTEEKIFSKLSDIVLARAFREIGLNSYVFKKRGNSADVHAESKIHKYSLVADAKSFRMSRTAKNQKDFKINALSNWKVKEDYSILCSPYFQYPRKKSQIYKQSLEKNVCLLSWEHLIFLIENKIKENKFINLENIWNFGNLYSEKISLKDSENNFFDNFNKEFCSTINIDDDNFNDTLINQITIIKNRSIKEKLYLEKEINIIKNYTKEQAISELLKSQKLEDRIKHIDDFIKKVKL